MSPAITDAYRVDAQGVKIFSVPVAGVWEQPRPGATFEVRNPATGELLGLVPLCGAPEAARALQAARKFNLWQEILPRERLKIFERACTLVSENAPLLADTVTRESGKPISLALGEVKSLAERLCMTLEETRVLHGEYIPGEWGPDTKNKFALVLRKPLGVVLAISPFNYPLFIAGSKIIPALLAGNTVIAKPASSTPLSLILFAKLLDLAGLPVGALSIITGRGREVGDALITSPDVDAISFTGSTPVGEGIAAKAGIKRLHLELGGKAAAIVMEDADLDLAAEQICRGVFRNSGQRCDAVSRVLVFSQVKEKFLEKILAISREYKTGDPLSAATALGTVIDQNAVDHIQRLVDDAVAKGAKVLLGGKSHGLFYEATVLDGVTTDMRLAWEEIFGPVMPVLTVADRAEAIRISNTSEFGLDSCVFTKNIDKAISTAKQLQDGSVTINGIPMHGLGLFPFGGNKKSGLGREGIKYSIDELTNLHTIIFSTQDPA